MTLSMVSDLAVRIINATTELILTLDCVDELLHDIYQDVYLETIGPSEISIVNDALKSIHIFNSLCEELGVEPDFKCYLYWSYEGFDTNLIPISTYALPDYTLDNFTDLLDWLRGGNNDESVDG